MREPFGPWKYGVVAFGIGVLFAAPALHAQDRPRPLPWYWQGADAGAPREPSPSHGLPADAGTVSSDDQDGGVPPALPTETPVEPSPGGTEGSAPPAAVPPPGSTGAGAPAAGNQQAFEWTWRQVLSSHRLSGRLTTVNVDPTNPNRVYVGTEEGTILVSRDGGLTWLEIEMEPQVIQDRSVLSPRPPGLPELGMVTPIGMNFYLDPPFRAKPPERLGLTFETLFFDIKPTFMSLLFQPRATFLSEDLLRHVVSSRRAYTVPVQRISVCPGANFPLIVATMREVLGSMDHGLTWVRLFRLPGRVRVWRVQCSRDDPNDMLVASDFGMFRSTDGGLTFDQDLSGWPGRQSTAVGYGPPDENGMPRIYQAVGDILFAGDPNSDKGMRMIYPDFNNSATAPWLPIWWIDSTPDGELWIATDDGVRKSNDFGKTWVPVARSLLERQQAWRVVIGSNERGGRRVAVMLRDCPVPPRPHEPLLCRGSYVYATDDGGETWFPFFHGISRRGFQHVEAAPAIPGIPPRWWVITGGELWATVAPKTRDEDVPEVILGKEASWAEEQLRKTPPLAYVLSATLDNVHLSSEEEQSLLDRVKKRNFLPIVNFQLFTGNVQGLSPSSPFGASDMRRRFAEQTLGGDATRFTVDETRDQQAVYFFLQATWALRDTHMVLEQLYPTRNALHELRRQVMFITEDAWHERRLHLRQIARGMSDPVQVATLKARIASLEAIIDVWMGEPLVRDDLSERQGKLP